jgi:hypothetical protein
MIVTHARELKRPPSAPVPVRGERPRQGVEQRARLFTIPVLF